VGKGWEAYVFIRDVIDLDKQLAKMKKDLAKYEKLVSRHREKTGQQKLCGERSGRGGGSRAGQDGGV
jgi:valyl-tRNA synthetase